MQLRGSVYKLQTVKWIGLALALPIMWSSLLVVFAGSRAFRSSAWRESIRQAAIFEVRRRGIVGKRISAESLAAIYKMVGDEAEEADTTDAHDTAIWALTGEDGEALEAELAANRQLMLDETINRLRTSVENVHTIVNASKIWVAQIIHSRTRVALRGVWWLLPRFIRNMTDLISRPGRVVTIVAVFVGAWVLWIKRDSETDLFHLISGLAIGGPALVCIWALGIITYRWIVANAGPPAEWNRRRVIQGTFVIPICMGLAVGMQKLSDWLKNKDYLGRYLDSVDPHSSNTMRVFCLLMIVGALVPMSRAARATMFPDLPISEKTGFVSFILFLFSVQILLGGIAVNGYSDTLSHTAGLIAFALSFLVMFCSWIMSGVEWVGKYKELRSRNIEVPRKGCSPRIFAYWIGSALLLAVAIPVNSQLRSSLIDLLLFPVVLFTGFGFYYLIAVSYFYIRRVSRIYERSQVRDVLELVAEVNDEGRSYLHLACIERDAESLRIFLEIGLDPNLQDQWGNTPLIYAMQNRVLNIIELLITYGADPYIENHDGVSSYSEAERMRDEDCIVIFANREWEDDTGPPPGG